MTRYALLPCLAASLLFLACDDSTGPSLPGTPAEAKSLLVGAKWLPAARTINPGFDMLDNGTIVTNVFAIEDACEHDDVMTLTADGKWAGDEGADKCDADAPQISTGTWSLNAAGDSVSITDDSDSQGDVNAKIVALTASVLSLAAASDDWPDGKTRTETFTWKAK
jgi:hypothetical protein